MGPHHEDEDDVPELCMCGGGGRLAGAPQTRTASTGDSVPILATGTQETVRWVLALGLSHCLGVPLEAGRLVTHLLLPV